ncbi:MAG: hypothetical protein WBF21_00460 [Steroidobacteraceae bacterium]
MATEERTARLTILVDPRKKVVFERLCAEEDSTPSQVLRRLMRSYIEERTGEPWSPSPAAGNSLEQRIKKPERTAVQKVEKRLRQRQG